MPGETQNRPEPEGRKEKKKLGPNKWKLGRTDYLHPAVTRSAGRSQEKEGERGRHESARHGVANHYSPTF